MKGLLKDREHQNEALRNWMATAGVTSLFETANYF